MCLNVFFFLFSKNQFGFLLLNQFSKKTHVITCLKLVNAASSSSPVMGMPKDGCMRCTKFLFSTRIL